MDNPDQFIEHDSARLRFRSEGSGPAVLFVHGWALDMDMWDAQVRALAPAYRVIAFDRRGFGLSTGQPGIESDVDDVQYLLGALDVQRTAIVGMSQGARVALRVALKVPGLVACLVLDGPPSERLPNPVGDADDVPMEIYRQLARQQGVAAFRQQWAHHPLMRLQTSDPAALSVLLTMIGRYPGRDLLNAESPASSIGQRLDSIAASVLVINGEHDTSARIAAGSAMTSLLPRARRSIVPAAGHIPSLDNPAAYNALLSGFLQVHAARMRETTI